MTRRSLEQPDAGVFVDNAFRSADKQHIDIIQRVRLGCCAALQLAFSMSMHELCRVCDA